MRHEQIWKCSNKTLIESFEYKFRSYYYNNSCIESSWYPIYIDYCINDVYGHLFYFLIPSAVMMFIYLLNICNSISYFL